MIGIRTSSAVAVVVAVIVQVSIDSAIDVYINTTAIVVIYAVVDTTIHVKSSVMIDIWANVAIGDD